MKMKEYKFDTTRVVTVYESKELIVKAENYDDAVDKLYDLCCTSGGEFPLPVVFVDTDALREHEEELHKLYMETQWGKTDHVMAEVSDEFLEYELVE